MVDNKLTVSIAGENKSLVVQSNSLIEAWQGMTANEKKLSAIIFSNIDSRNIDFDEYMISVLDIAKSLKISKKNEYKIVLDILERLQKRLYWVHSPTEKFKDRYVRISIISKTIYYSATGEIAVSVHDDLKPYLLEIKKSFTSLSLDTYLALDNFFDIRLCELLKKYKKLGKVVFEIEDLRNKLGLNVYDIKRKLIKRKYSAYKDFKKYILSPSEKKLKIKDENGNFPSNEYFSFREIKKSRRVTHIELIIHKHIIPKKQTIENKSNEPEPETNLQKTLLKYGISKANVSVFLSEHDEKYLLEKIEHFKKANKTNPIGNSGGWLTKAIKDDWKGKDVITAQRNKEIAQNKRTELEAEKKRKTEEKKRHSAILQVKSDFLESLSDDQKTQILEKMKQDPDNGKLVSKLDSGMARSLLPQFIPDYETKLQEQLQATKN